MLKLCLHHNAVTMVPNNGVITKELNLSKFHYTNAH
jgi:hypothetical protein